MWRQDIFGNAAILEDANDGGAEGPTAEDLLTPEPVLQQKGWLNWLSLGLLGAADRPDAGQIFPQEIIKVRLPNLIWEQYSHGNSFRPYIFIYIDF